MSPTSSVRKADKILNLTPLNNYVLAVSVEKEKKFRILRGISCPQEFHTQYV
jgi:hypothetical protein